MNIDTAVFPGAVPTDPQAVPDAIVAGVDSPESQLFSLALASEEEKVMSLTNMDPVAGSENIPLAGLVLPTEQTDSETPDAQPVAKTPDPGEASYLLLLPFLAFSPGDPLWQNLPNRAKAAGQTTESTEAPEGAKAESISTEAPVAVPVSIPIAMAAPALPAVQEQAGLATEAKDVKAAVPCEQHPFLVERRSAKIEAGSTVAKATPEIPAEAVDPKTDLKIDSRIDTEKEAPSSVKTGEATPPRSPVHHTRAVHQAAREGLWQQPETKASSVDLSSSTPSTEMQTGSIALPHELTIIKPEPAPAPHNGERLDTRASDDAGENSSRPVASPAMSPVTAAADTSHQGNANGDSKRQNRAEIELQVATRPISRESSALPAHPVSQGRQESKGSDLGLNVRSEGLLHEAINRIGESPRAQDPVAATPSEHWSQIEKANVLSQLIEKARSIRWDQNTEIVVSLKPESLGRISMRALLVDKTLVAMIAAESDKVKQLIQVEIPAIQQALHESGIPARVVVANQSDIAFDYNNSSNGQSRFRQSAPDATLREEMNPSANPATPEATDSRYSTNSVHLIA